MGVNECLHPSTGAVVLDLDDVGECGRAVWEGKEFEGGWVVVMLAVDELLSLCDGVSRGQRGRRGGDLG